MITKYAGMSYEQMSRVAMDLIQEAARTGKWHHIMNDLNWLKKEMRMLESPQKYIQPDRSIHTSKTYWKFFPA